MINLKGISFIHVADLHLDSQINGINQELPPEIVRRCKECSYISFNRIVNKAIEQQVDFMIIAGDIYDSYVRNIRAQLRFKIEMERLSFAKIDVFIIHGNHDYLVDRKLLDLPKNVYVFGSEVESIPYRRNGEIIAYIHGFSYSSKKLDKSQLMNYKKKDTEHFHIGVLHGGIGSDFTITELQEKRYDYWALGHIHKRQVLNEKSSILYPGNIQARHKKEIGEKGCMLVRLEKNNIEIDFCRTDDICFKKVEFVIDKNWNLTEIVEILRDTIELQREIVQGVFLSIILQGYCSFVDEINELICEWREEERYDFIWIIECLDKTYEDMNLVEGTFLEEILKENCKMENIPMIEGIELTMDDYKEIEAEARKILLRLFTK